MKRLWIGVGVLLALLGAGFWAMGYAHGQQDKLCRLLEDAKQAALEEDWQRVDRLTEKARGFWEDGWGIWAALSDHTELDQVDASFARLEVYCRDGHATDFAAESAALAEQIKALGDGHRLSFWNLL